MLTLNLQEDWFVLRDNSGIYDFIIVLRVTFVWTVQNVIDVKDQMKFKVLLANWWSPSPEVGDIERP